MADRTTALLRVRDLKIGFDLPGGQLIAVNGVSFVVRPGGTVALVGESGSGKTVVSQAIMGLLPRAATIQSASSALRPLIWRKPKRRASWPSGRGSSVQSHPEWSTEIDRTSTPRSRASRTSWAGA